MATRSRSFVGTIGALQFLGAPDFTYPFSMAVWWKPTTFIGTTVFGLGESATDGTLHYVALGFTSGNKAFVEGGIGGDSLSSASAAFDDTTWYHLGCVCTSATDWKVYLNGVAGSALNNNYTPPGTVNRISGPGAYFDGGGSPSARANGKGAHFAFWEGRALTGAEMASLAGGASPLSVHPTDLGLYWKVIGETPEVDFSGNSRHGAIVSAPVYLPTDGPTVAAPVDGLADGPVPTFVSAGAVGSGTATFTPGLPAGTQDGDILILAIKTSNQAVSVSGGNLTWIQAANSPQSIGTAAATTGSRVTVFWARRSATTPTMPTVSDSGNMQLARCIAIRGCTTVGSPVEITSGGTEATADTSGSIPGATTEGANRLIVAIAAHALPDAIGTAVFSAWANSDLANVTERTDNSDTAGVGGALGIATGEKATAGAYGATTYTGSANSAKAFMTLALMPERVVSGIEHDDAPTGGMTLSGSRTESKTGTETRSGTLTLTGSKTQTWQKVDTATGTLTLSGTKTEKWGHVETRSGTIALTGTNVEEWATAKTAAGTLTLSGTKTETHTGTETRTGTITLTGTRTESKTTTETRTGTLTLSGTATDDFGIEYVDAPTGTLALGGAKTEAHTGTETRSGSLTLNGSTGEEWATDDAETGTLTFSGSTDEEWATAITVTGTITLGGVFVEQFQGATVYADTPTGSITLNGTRVEAATCADTAAGGPSLAGACTNTHTLAEAPHGALTITGGLSEASQFTSVRTGSLTAHGQLVENDTRLVAVAGTITLTGTKTETRGYHELATGSIALSGTSSDEWAAIYTDTPAGSMTLTGSNTETSVSPFTRITYLHDKPRMTVTLGHRPITRVTVGDRAYWNITLGSEKT